MENVYAYKVSHETSVYISTIHTDLIDNYVCSIPVGRSENVIIIMN